MRPRPRNGRWGPFYGEVNLWAINRPHIAVAWMDTGLYDVSLSWGNGNSDPVWFVAAKVRLPRWVVRYVDREAAS